MRLLFVFVLTMAMTFELSSSLPTSCLKNCSKPFGEKIGSFEGVEAYSNCNCNCISLINHFYTAKDSNAYAGMKWQCVEYARRFLIKKFGVYFDDVGSAFQIYDKPHVLSLKKQQYLFESYDNGSLTPPQKYDVVIYKRAKDAPYGHVAIICDVNLLKGYFEVCEQNYSLWKDQSYSRRLQMLYENGRYVLTEEPHMPYVDKTQLLKALSRPNSTLGWKRVRLENSP